MWQSAWHPSVCLFVEESLFPPQLLYPLRYYDYH